MASSKSTAGLGDSMSGNISRLYATLKADLANFAESKLGSARTVSADLSLLQMIAGISRKRNIVLLSSQGDFLSPQQRQHCSRLEALSRLVCQICRDGLFSAVGFQRTIVPCSPLGESWFRYTMTWSQLHTSVALGCHWCGLISYAQGSNFDNAPIMVEVKIRTHNTESHTDVQVLTAVIAGRCSISGVWYTTPGTSIQNIIHP